MLKAPLGHFAHGGKIFTHDACAGGGLGGSGNFIDDVAVGFAGAVEVAEALAAESELVNCGSAPVWSVVEFGELLVDLCGAVVISTAVKFVGNFVAGLALPISPDSRFFLTVFLTGLEEFQSLLGGLGVAIEFFEGLDEEVLRLGGQRAGREGVEEELGLGDGFRIITG